MTEKSLDLSLLIDFVSHILSSTDSVRSILQSECDEARFALKPWPVETVVKELDQNACTCFELPSAEEQFKEIAAGISRAILQAQQLREKLAINIAREKKRSRAPSVSTIYAPGVKSPDKSICKKVFSQKQSATSSKCENVNNEKENGQRNCDRNYLDNKATQGLNNSPAGAKTTKLTAKKDCSKGTSKESPSATYKKIIGTKVVPKEKSITEKKLLKPSPYNALATKSTVKSKPQKNFIATNKSNVKNVKSTETIRTSKSLIDSKSKSSLNLVKSSPSDIGSNTSERNSSLSTYTASTSELDKLISRMSLDSAMSLRTSSPSAKETRCPLHHDNAPKFIEQRIVTTVDVVEGLDRYGVSPELVKILKVYYNYLKEDLLDEPSVDKREDRAVKKFLSDFEIMNAERSSALNSDKLTGLTVKFTSLFKESHSSSIDAARLNEIKTKYANLDSEWKSCNIEQMPIIKTRKRSGGEISFRNSSQETYGWKSNAIWNDASSISLMKGMSEAHCVRYANKNQLLLLVHVMQQLQRVQYSNDLTNLLKKNIIPGVRRLLDPSTTEYAETYKMISVICQVLNPKIPVLVRTDK